MSVKQDKYVTHLNPFQWEEEESDEDEDDFSTDQDSNERNKNWQNNNGNHVRSIVCSTNQQKATASKTSTL